MLGSQRESVLVTWQCENAEEIQTVFQNSDSFFPLKKIVETLKD